MGEREGERERKSDRQDKEGERERQTEYSEERGRQTVS